MSLSFGNPSVGIGSLGVLDQCIDLYGNPCVDGGSSDPSGVPGADGSFNWGGLAAAIAAAGNAGAAIVKANQYPYPYGNPYNIYGGGITQGMYGAYQTGGYAGVQAYQNQYGGGLAFGGSTMMLLMVGLVAVMAMSARR